MPLCGLLASFSSKILNREVIVSDSSKGSGAIQTHVVYDKVSGKVLGQFQRYDVAQDQYCQCDSEEVLRLFRDDETVLKKVTDGVVDNLAVFSTTLPVDTDIGRMLFSPNRQTLVSKPRLQIRADRDVLEGDGEDSVTLFINVVDDQGRMLRGAKGGIQVTTTRGKLSAKGGQVKIDQGQGQVVLTSVRETVNKVWVRASTPNNVFLADSLLLHFV